MCVRCLRGRHLVFVRLLPRHLQLCLQPRFPLTRVGDVRRRLTAVQLSKYPHLNKLEQQIQVPKAYGVLGFAGVFASLVFFNIFAGFLSNLLGWGLPAYLSLKALETPGHDE